MQTARPQAPAWLGRPYDFVNRRKAFGDYLDDPKGAGGPLQQRAAEPEADAHAEACGGLRAWLPLALGGLPAPSPASDSARNFGLALTVLLDHAREAAWQHNRVHVRNDVVLRPSTVPHDGDVRRAWSVAQQTAAHQRTLDLFARLEVAALAPVADLDGRMRSIGQARVISHLFAKLVPGCSVDLGRNFLEAQHWQLLDFSQLQLPYALNLGSNTVTAPALHHLLSANMTTLRHFHCRTGLVLDGAGLADLAQLLAAQTHLETLELGIEAPVRWPPHAGGGGCAAPLNLLPLFELPLPHLKAFYLSPPQRSVEAVRSLSLRNMPRLERLALDITWSREAAQRGKGASAATDALSTWQPAVPASLRLVWLSRNPPQRSKNRLRHTFNQPLAPSQRFADQHDVVWPNYFERTSGFGHNKSFWSLQREAFGLRPETGIGGGSDAAHPQLSWTV